MAAMQALPMVAIQAIVLFPQPAASGPFERLALGIGTGAFFTPPQTPFETFV